MNCAAKSVLMCDGKESVACCADSLHYPAALMQDAIKRRPSVAVPFAMSYIVVIEYISKFNQKVSGKPHSKEYPTKHRRRYICVLLLA